jgi:hypothetical protein
LRKTQFFKVHVGLVFDVHHHETHAVFPRSNRAEFSIATFVVPRSFAIAVLPVNLCKVTYVIVH